MKKIATVGVVVFTFIAACSTPEEPKATSAPVSQASPSVGRQYGETLSGGVARAKDMQKKMDERTQQMDEAARQNQPSRAK